MKPNETFTFRSYEAVKEFINRRENAFNLLDLSREIKLNHSTLKMILEVLERDGFIQKVTNGKRALYTKGVCAV